jgi:hypothetical protein
MLAIGLVPRHLTADTWRNAVSSLASCRTHRGIAEGRFLEFRRRTFLIGALWIFRVVRNSGLTRKEVIQTATARPNDIRFSLLAASDRRLEIGTASSETPQSSNCVRLGATHMPGWWAGAQIGPAIAASLFERDPHSSTT